MKTFYVIRPYCIPSGFNVIAEDKKEAIILSNKTYGICYDTVAREISTDIPGVLVSEKTIKPFEQNPLPNFKENGN